MWILSWDCSQVGEVGFYRVKLACNKELENQGLCSDYIELF